MLAAVLTALAFQLPARAPTRATRTVALQASTLTADESSLLGLIAEEPEKKAPLLEACASLSAIPDGLEALEGDWRVEWTSLGKGFAQKLLFSIFSPSLKMLSFGALPPVKVNLTASYNRVALGRYDLLQCFELPSTTGGDPVGVAMALCGSGSVSSEQSNRLDVQFEKVVLVPATGGDADEFHAALDAAGLVDGAGEPIDIDVKPTYIDLTHLSDSLRVHKGASGSTYVLQRVDEIPYEL